MSGVPTQLEVDGVTIIFAVIGAFVVFNAVNAAISPEPDTPKPIDALSFVQSN